MISQIINSSRSITDILPFIRLTPIEKNCETHFIGLGSAGTYVLEHFFNENP